MKTKPKTTQASKADSELHINKKVAGGATGVVLGAVMGGPVGAIIGGVVGTAIGSAAGGSPSAPTPTKSAQANRITMKPARRSVPSKKKPFLNAKPKSARMKKSPKRNTASKTAPGKAIRGTKNK